MPNIRVKLIGFGEKAAGSETLHEKIPEGTSFQNLWEKIRQTAENGSLLSEISEKKVLFLCNSQPLRRMAVRRQTILSEGDQVTIMIMVAGG